MRRRKNGTLIDVALTVSPIRNSRGQVTAASSIARDISERKRAEAKFRGLLEAAPDAVVVVNQEGRSSWSIRRWRSCSDTGGTNCWAKPLRCWCRHASGTNIRPTARVFSPILASPMGAGVELYALRKDGTEFPTEISLSPLETEEGVLVSSAIRDITERRAVEDELRHSRAVLQGLFESLPGLFLIFTSDLKIVSASDAFSKPP